jgi:WD40 repeat protein/tRNA A-37 threonylcarbamoyl transferase component Bud32
MPVAEAHPSAEELAGFTLGTLDDEAQASIEAHVAACTSCQERAAVAPGDSLVELLRRVDARADRGADTFAEAAAQVQTPTPLAAVAETEGLAPAVALRISAESGRPKVPDAVPPELARHERYLVLRLLGAGGMGAVYEAEHRVMRRRVAVKVIKRDYTANPNALERFRREVENAARLSHSNIVATTDAEDAGETHFLVMEYVEGTDLGRLVQERGPRPVDRACDYVRQAALGLQYAFEQGMVHRDLKPHNLMLTPDGRVKILDFGLAHFASEAAPAACRTGTGIVLGTVDYIAPEQADNAHQADIRSDIYSLGCTLYHLLAGQPPFPTGTPIQKVMAHVEKKPQPLTELRDDLPEGLMPVLERMMAKNPKHRYQTPAEVAVALEPFTFGPPPRDEGRTVVIPDTSGRIQRQRRFLVATAVLAFLVAGLLGGAVYRIATDKGELVITTESDDVKVVITQGGKLVDVIDPKTDEQIRLTLRSGEYELELKGAPKGLKLDIERAKLKRGETVLATITRKTPIDPPIPLGSKFLTLPIDKVASAVSTKSLFSGGDHERLIFPKWGKQEVFRIPFDVTDPKGGSVKNAIVLYGAPGSQPAEEMPKFVRLKCGSAAKVIHFLSGVAGNAYPGEGPRNEKTVCVIVRLHYRDGKQEDHELRNGVHFCDIGADEHNEVPGSRRAVRLLDFGKGLNHIRYLTIEPKSPAKVIEEIEFIKGMKGDVTAPVIMAVTVEKPVPPAEEGGEARRLVDRLVGHTDQPWKAAFLPDGKRVLSAGCDKVLRLWDAETGRELGRFEDHSDGILAVAVSPDGRMALSGGGGLSFLKHHDPGTDFMVRLWDLTSRRLIHRLVGHTHIVWCVALSPDGRRALSGSEDKSMRLWDVATGREVRRFPHNEWVMGVCFSPDSRWGLSSTGNGDVVLWELETGRDLRHFRGHTGHVCSVAFSPDGRHILSVGADRTARVWDVRTGSEVRNWTTMQGGGFIDVAFSPDGRRALTGGWGGIIQLWEVETGKELNRYVRPGDGNVQCVAISPDGRTALSVCHFNWAVSLWPLPDPPPAKANP